MLDQLSQSSEALYLRAVRPSQQAQLRPDSTAAAHLTQNKNEPVNQQQVQKAQRRREVAEQQQEYRSDNRQNQSDVASQASRMADRLTAQLQRARQNETRQVDSGRDSEHTQRQRLERAYDRDLPKPAARFIDEMA